MDAILKPEQDPVIFRVISSEFLSDSERLFRSKFEELRRQVYVEREGFEHRSDADHYDSISDYILATLGRDVLGGCRLIARKRAGILPIENYLKPGFRIYPQGIEISRMVGIPGERSIVRGLYGYVLEILEGMGCEMVYMTIRGRYLEALKHQGPSCYELLPGTPMEKTGKSGRKELFYPAAISLTGMNQLIRFLRMISH